MKIDIHKKIADLFTALPRPTTPREHQFFRSLVDLERLMYVMLSESHGVAILEEPGRPLERPGPYTYVFHGFVNIAEIQMVTKFCTTTGQFRVVFPQYRWTATQGLYQLMQDAIKEILKVTDFPEDKKEPS